MTTQVWLGEKGLEQSQQGSFPTTVVCVHCASLARVAFVLQENGAKPFICELHQSETGKFWPHDVTAFAVYLCTKCAKPTAIFNQG